MGRSGRIICDEIICADIIRLYIVEEQMLIAVMYIEECRSFLVPLKGKRQFGKESVPRVVDDIDSHIGMNLLISFSDTAEHILCCPDPPVNSDGFAVVDKMVGIVSDIVPHDLQTFVRLCVLRAL